MLISNLNCFIDSSYIYVSNIDVLILLKVKCYLLNQDVISVLKWEISPRCRERVSNDVFASPECSVAQLLGNELQKQVKLHRPRSYGEINPTVNFKNDIFLIKMTTMFMAEGLAPHLNDQITQLQRKNQLLGKFHILTLSEP